MSQRADRTEGGGVVDLAERRRARDAYEQNLAELRRRLHALDEYLFDAAVQLAMLGPWREWSEAQPEGAVVELDGDALLASGDPHVAAVVRLHQALEPLLELLGEPD